MLNGALAEGAETGRERRGSRAGTALTRGDFAAELTGIEHRLIVLERPVPDLAAYGLAARALTPSAAVLPELLQRHPRRRLAGDPRAGARGSPHGSRRRHRQLGEPVALDPRPRPLLALPAAAPARLAARLPALSQPAHPQHRVRDRPRQPARDEARGRSGQARHLSAGERPSQHHPPDPRARSARGRRRAATDASTASRTGPSRAPIAAASRTTCWSPTVAPRIGRGLAAPAPAPLARRLGGALRGSRRSGGRVSVGRANRWLPEHRFRSFAAGLHRTQGCAAQPQGLPQRDRLRDRESRRLRVAGHAGGRAPALHTTAQRLDIAAERDVARPRPPSRSAACARSRCCAARRSDAAGSPC